MNDLVLQKVNLNNQKERNEVQVFLEHFGLSLDDDVDYTIILRDRNGELKASCSKARNIFKCFAVSEDLRGENITSSLVSTLMDKSYEENIYHNLIYTKLCNAKKFASLNFNPIYQVENAVLLEHGIYDINKALDRMALKYDIDTITPKGALVMNCNPFTNGHRYLVEEAAENCSQVLLFLVVEDKSLFPFKYRYEIVKEAVKDLENVIVIPGGEYIISSATFPSYFLRKEDERLKSYTEMDCGIFGKYFCSKFNIEKRFVGQEPFCRVTNAYNGRMKDILPGYGVQLVEIERKMAAGEYISASRVRELIKDNQMTIIEKLVPETTWKFLNSSEGKGIMGRIKKSNSPH